MWLEYRTAFLYYKNEVIQMKRTVRFSLNNKKFGSQITVEGIHVGDDNSCELAITITDGNKVLDITDGSTIATMSGTKPDGTVINRNCSIVDNTIFYTLEKQDTAVSGNVLYQITVASDNDISRSIIATAKFTVSVMKNIYVPIYRLLSTEPPDWSSNYKSYFRLVNNRYTAISDLSCPTFIDNTFYCLVNPNYDSEDNYESFHAGLARLENLIGRASDILISLSDKANKATTLSGYGIMDGECVGNKVSTVDFQNPSKTDYPNIVAIKNFYDSYVEPAFDILNEEKADKSAMYKKSDNLVSFKDGSYEIRGVSVKVENDTITIKGVAAEGSSVLSIPFKNKVSLASDKYVFSMLNIINTTSNRPTIWLSEPYQAGVNTDICRVCEYKLQLNNTSGGTASVLIDKTNDTESTSVSRIKFAPVAGKEYDVSFNLSLTKGEGRIQYINRYSPYNVLNLYNSLGVMNPEAYGVVGDGITDDTASLQAMIYDACRKRKKIELGRGKTYLISDTLRFNNPWLDFDGNGATIVLSDKIGGALSLSSGNNADGKDKAQLLYAIYINTGKDCDGNLIYNTDKRLDENGNNGWGVNNYKARMFGNVTIDCNCGVARYGIYIDQGVKLKVHDIVINDAEVVGLYTGTGNWENIIENIHCNRCRLNHKAKANSVGFSINSSDSYINNCVSIDYDIGFINYSGDNHFSCCHVWNNFATNTEDNNIKTDAENRVGFANNGEYATYSQCTIDSCGIGWLIGDNTSRTMLIGCVSAYPNSIRKNAKTVTLIKFSSNNKLKGKSVVISASYLKPGKTETDDSLQTYNFDNLLESDSPIIIDNMVDGWNVAHTTK